MPARNAGKYIAEAVESVLAQNHAHWELLIIDNGSTDDTATVVKRFDDRRVQYLFEETPGVGHARNAGLHQMKGDFFCFLDSDDTMPPNALSARLRVFEANDDVAFVDGKVDYVDEHMQPLGKTYVPDFEGYPFERLIKLDSRCLFGNSWMIRFDPDQLYQFDTTMTHAEDLYFYLSIAKGKTYAYTSETVLNYRQSDHSAMKDLSGLESGYVLLIKNVKHKLGVGGSRLLFLKLKIAKIMILSFLFNGRNLLAAIRSPFKILFT